MRIQESCDVKLLDKMKNSISCQINRMVTHGEAYTLEEMQDLQWELMKIEDRIEEVIKCTIG